MEFAGSNTAKHLWFCRQFYILRLYATKRAGPRLWAFVILSLDYICGNTGLCQIDRQRAILKTRGETRQRKLPQPASTNWDSLIGDIILLVIMYRSTIHVISDVDLAIGSALWYHNDKV